MIWLMTEEDGIRAIERIEKEEFKVVVSYAEMWGDNRNRCFGRKKTYCLTSVKSGRPSGCSKMLQPGASFLKPLEDSPLIFRLIPRYSRLFAIPKAWPLLCLDCPWVPSLSRYSEKRVIPTWTKLRHFALGTEMYGPCTVSIPIHVLQRKREAILMLRKLFLGNWLNIHFHLQQLREEARGSRGS